MNSKNTDTLTDLAYLGLLSISGEQAKKLLQGQLTCDLEEISATQTRLGAHCNPQGRVLSLFRILMLHDQYYLQMPRELVSIALTALKKYAMFYKVILNDASDTFKQIGYSGELLNSVLAELPQEINEAIQINDLLIIKVPGTRYIILGDPTKVESLIENLKSQAEVNDTTAIWKSMDIAAGIPAIYPETSAKFLPHELNLPLLNGVSFKKGCYTGQEIIARMEYRGKLKNHLHQASATTTQLPVRGEAIYRNKDSCGSIVDYCQLGYNKVQLLVIAPDSDINTTPLSLDPQNEVILEF